MYATAATIAVCGVDDNQACRKTFSLPDAISIAMKFGQQGNYGERRAMDRRRDQQSGTKLPTFRGRSPFSIWQPILTEQQPVSSPAMAGTASRRALKPDLAVVTTGRSGHW